MGITSFFKTLFGSSEFEKELRKDFDKSLETRRDKTESIKAAKLRLEKAQNDVHDRVHAIRRSDSVHDA